MTEQDTVRLLRECDAGVDMGVNSIDEVLEQVQSPALRDCLAQSRTRHKELSIEIDRQLDDCGEPGKELGPVAKGMAWVKTNVKLAMDGSDHAIADMVTDGCDMGVKSLTRYLNQYPAASNASKDIAHRLISLEEGLKSDLQRYL